MTPYVVVGLAGKIHHHLHYTGKKHHNQRHGRTDEFPWRQTGLHHRSRQRKLFPRQLQRLPRPLRLRHQRKHDRAARHRVRNVQERIRPKGIKSNAMENMVEHGMFIRAGRPIMVRVAYDGWSKNLQISAGYVDNASGSSLESLLNCTVELQKTVPRSAYVGFSAATGNSYEVHKILDWNFSSVSVPESSLNLSPVGTPGGSSGGGKVRIVVGSVVGGVALIGLAKRKKQAAGSLRLGNFSGELALIGNAPQRFLYRHCTSEKQTSERENLQVTLPRTRPPEVVPRQPVGM
ncbi:hypothetical protein KI387_040523, partial [Taxus chinensis]